MSTNDTFKQPTPAYVTLTSGSVAAIGATVATQPLARLKWLRQVSEGKSIVTKLSYFNVFKSIIQNEGIFGLFKGVTGGISRNIPHAALVYTLFPKVRDTIIIYNNDRYRLDTNNSLINTLSGGVSAIIVTFFTHPIDTLRVRYTVQYTSLRYTSYPQLFNAMLSEGISSFYRGMFVTTVGTAIGGGVCFGIYETFKSDEMRKWHANYPVFQRLSIGFVAGAVSTTAAYPADTVRRRMMVWGKQRLLTTHELEYFGEILPEYVKNGRTLFMHIGRTEGFLGYFKGLGMTMIKTPIATAVSLTVNDMAKKLIFDINA